MKINIMKKIIFASNNLNKFNELKEILKDDQFNILRQSDFNISPIKENKLTFIENAIIKARNASKITGYASISDDSGLTVDVLKNRPGIYSSRFSGKESNDKKNIEKILLKIKFINENNIKAKLHCILIFMRNYRDPSPIISYGCCKGIISRIPMGNNGFGYDKIFYIDKLKKTLAQMTKEEKNIISHRGKALRLLLKYIKND